MRGEVIVVTYNHARHVVEALGSIERQIGVPPFKVKVYDDHSQDDTLAVIEAYRRSSSLDIEVFASERNLGVQANYLRAFAGVDGEWVAILEGDDFWHDPGHLRTCTDCLVARPEISGVFSRLVLQNEHDGHRQERQYPANMSLYTAGDLARENVIGNFSSCVYRVSALRQVVPSYAAHRATDWFFNLLMADLAPLMLNRAASTTYRIHQKGVWSSMDRKAQIRELMFAIRIYDAHFESRYTRDFRAHAASVRREQLSARLAGIRARIHSVLRRR